MGELICLTPKSEKLSGYIKRKRLTVKPGDVHTLSKGVHLSMALSPGGGLSVAILQSDSRPDFVGYQFYKRIPIEHASHWVKVIAYRMVTPEQPGSAIVELLTFPKHTRQWAG